MLSKKPRVLNVYYERRRASTQREKGEQLRPNSSKETAISKKTKSIPKKLGGEKTKKHGNEV